MVFFTEICKGKIYDVFHEMQELLEFMLVS